MSRVDQQLVRSVGPWILWAAMLALSTATLVGVRGEIEQSHAALTLLLVVLGGSAGGGRPLGYALALMGSVLIDYFFQAPYGTLAVGKTLDWVVLVAFLASAFVATELLAQARGEAETARRRTEEVALLSRLGSTPSDPAYHRRRRPCGCRLRPLAPEAGQRRREPPVPSHACVAIRRAR